MPVEPNESIPADPLAVSTPRPALADRTRIALLRMNAHPWPWLTLLIVLLAMQVGPWWHPTPDARSYLSMARSFVSGEGMTNLGREQLYYSPGYSLLISPAFLFGDRPFLAISLLQFGLALVALWGVYVWARQTVREGALLVTAFAFVNVLVWIHYRRTLSEMPFLCAVVWTVLSMQWTLAAPSLRAALWRAVPTAALLLATCLLRQAGVAVAAGFGTALLIDLGRRHVSFSHAAILLTVVCLPAALAVWIVVQNDVQASAGEDTYLDGFVVADSSLATQIVECVRMRICDIGRVVVPGMFKAYSRSGSWLNANMPLYVAVTGLVAFGWWRMVRARCDIMALALPFYLGLYMTWPFETGGRFLVPLAPLLAVCLWYALEPIARHRMNILAYLVVFHLAVAIGYWGAIDMPRAIDYFRRWDAIDTLAAAVDVEHEKVGIVGLPIETRLMLELALDRPVVEAPTVEQLAQLPEWIVEPAGRTSTAGFTVYRGVDQLRLLSRTSAAQNSAAAETARGPSATPSTRR
ncbi:MAG: hypothetical protein KF708_04700 [Pirellulales bacterium]|nr:hypothetical protein [Pirellulales bacterium]